MRKYRLLNIKSPSKNNKNFIKANKIFDENFKEFHKRCTKKKITIDENIIFVIELIGFDKEIKKKYTKLDIKVVFNDIDKMPMGYKRCNFSLFRDDNPKNTVKGLGYKDKNKALYTIYKIKNMPIKYQVQVISTMLGRAKTHPHQTKDMIDAIKIFQKWLKLYHKNIKK